MTLPEPMTPADCDLRDFQFMPLDVARLRDSDLIAKETPEAAIAAILLWCAAWHQVPAASLPDDDVTLARLAGYGRVVEAWRAVRSGALRNWTACADGRLYHPVVAEKARESWLSKLEHAFRRLCDRIRKENKAREASGLAALPIPTFDAWNSNGRVDTIPSEARNVSAGIPAENALKGQGQGQGQGQGKGKEKPKPLARAALGIEFEAFWLAYPRKRSKGDAEKAWRKLNPDGELVERIMSALTRAKTRRKWLDEPDFIPYPASWLNAKSWDDDDGPAETVAPGREI